MLGCEEFEAVDKSAQSGDKMNVQLLPMKSFLMAQFVRLNKQFITRPASVLKVLSCLVQFSSISITKYLSDFTFSKGGNLICGKGWLGGLQSYQLLPATLLYVSYLPHPMPPSICIIIQLSSSQTKTRTSRDVCWANPRP